MTSNSEIIQKHYAGSDRGDLAAMIAPLSLTTAWTEMAGFPLAGTYVGRDAIVANVFAALGQDWDGFTVKIDRLIDGGDTIVAIGNYSATYKKTGKAMTARVVHVWDMQGGMVRGFEQFTDTALVAAAMR